MCSMDQLSTDQKQSVCIMCRHCHDSLDVHFISSSTNRVTCDVAAPNTRPSQHQMSAVSTKSSQCTQQICTSCLPASSGSLLRQRHHRQPPSSVTPRTFSTCSQQSQIKSVYPLIRKFAHRLSKMSLNGNLLLTFFLFAILSSSQVSCPFL